MNLPFNAEQFLEIFQKYNTTLFPMQLILLASGVLMIVIIHLQFHAKNRTVNTLLGLVWLWNGIAYHYAFFTKINKAAFVFALIFVIQGIFFIIEAFSSNKVQYKNKKSIRQYVGYMLVLFALFIYPLFGIIQGHGIPETISIGLPCPTVIFTFGIFMFATEKFPKYLLIIPTIWAIIGSSAAWNFGISQDVALIITALVVDLWIIFIHVKKTPSFSQ